MTKIKLDNLLNTRDLGGIKTKHGYTIKSKRLIRSGKLYDASDNDINILTKKYNLNTIIDLRTIKEITQKPDPKIKGVINHHLPLFEGFLTGISKENKDDFFEDEFKQFVFLLEKMGDAKKDMMNLYPSLLKEKYARNSFNSIFKLLASNSEGSILYHCSAGKDRVGVLTLLILSALGVEKDVIIEDYLKTNKFYEKTILNQIEFANEQNIDENLIKQIPYAQGVHIDFILAAYDYIESEFKSVDNYIKTAIGISDEEILNIRFNYLK